MRIYGITGGAIAAAIIIAIIVFWIRLTWFGPQGPSVPSVVGCSTGGSARRREMT
ncbi:MAG: hypothetical protein ACYTGG_06050 [Planctomycetota bacterium]|jgi:hypothetical protein